MTTVSLYLKSMLEKYVVLITNICTRLTLNPTVNIFKQHTVQG